MIDGVEIVPFQNLIEVSEVGSVERHLESTKSCQSVNSVLISHLGNRCFLMSAQLRWLIARWMTMHSTNIAEKGENIG